MSEEAAFLEAIARNPADKTARLVFADWLQERGDPRAPWVRDDELWEWMMPQAKDPTGDLVAATARAREGHKTVGALVRLGPSALPKVFAFLAKGVPGASNLHDALELLGPSAEPQLALLLKETQSEKRDARFGAYRCLARLAPHNEKAMEAVRAGASHTDYMIRQLAIATLAGLGAQERTTGREREAECRTLHELVRSGTEEQAADALRALVKFGGLDESLIPALVRHTINPANPARDAAIRGLAQLGEPGARGLLAAAVHFAGSGWFSGAFKTIGAVAVPPLREALNSPDDKVRQLATVMLTERLESAPDPELMPEVVSALIALFRSPETEYHRSARYALDRLGPAAQAAVVLPLREELNNPNGKVRQPVTVMLAEHLARAPVPELMPEVVSALIALFRSPETEYHRSARYALDRLGPAGRAVAPVLLECIGRGDEFIRDYRATFSALGLSAGEVVPTLLRAVESLPLDRVRSYGRDLGELGHGRAALLHAMRRPGPNVLSEVREILSQVSFTGLKELDDVLRKETGADHSSCRELARLVLEASPDEAIDVITPFLSDKSKVTRLVAVHALWHANSTESVPGLLLALRDKDKTVRITALRALGQLGAGTAGVEGTVRAMLTDRAQDVRDVALEVLVTFAPKPE